MEYMVNPLVDLNNTMPFDLRKNLESQNYYLVGNHSGVKLCHWLKQDLQSNGSCYKDRFYGIAAYRCLQVSPALTWCTERCSFCWRSESYAMGSDMSKIVHDDPNEILVEMINGQRKLISGYGGHSNVNRTRWEEANSPIHVAISLSGEPTLYKHLDEFLGICHNMGLSTFLVTNGTQPEVLANLENLPTQLYLTIAGASPKVHSAITRPFDPKKAWNSMLETIDLMPSLNTRKVIRLTLVKGKNMIEPDKYAELFFKSQSHFLEAKGFVSVGDARKNYGYEYMPKLEEIVEFSHDICDNSPNHLEIIDLSSPSNCTLIASEDYTWRKIDFGQK